MKLIDNLFEKFLVICFTKI